MSETKPIYSGEALLRNWSESASGKRRIILEIEDNGGAHPFKGYEGERFGVVIVGPLASAEHAAPATNEGGEGRGTTAPAKPKRRWQDMPPSQRAALMVRHAAFPAFALTAWGVECGPDEALKAELGIASKSSLDPDDVGRQDGGLLQRFESIERQFEAFKIARGHGVI